METQTIIDPETGEVLEEKEQKEYRNEPFENETPAELLLDELYGIEKRKENAMMPIKAMADSINAKYDPQIKRIKKQIENETMYRQETIAGNHVRCEFVPSHMRLKAETVKNLYRKIYDECCEETAARVAFKKIVVKKKKG